MFSVSHWYGTSVGEAVCVSNRRRLHARTCADKPGRFPCIFEYVYFARPDSIIEGISVYQSRLRIGSEAGRKNDAGTAGPWHRSRIPVPDTSLPSALRLATRIGVRFCEGFVKIAISGAPSSCRIAAAEPLSVKRNSIPSVGVQWRKPYCGGQTPSCGGPTSRQIIQMAQ